MADEMYNYFDMLIAESPEPTAVSERRRELASELKAISEQLIRLDADEAALAEYTEQARALRERLEGHGHRSMRDILGRLIVGKGSRQDALDMADFEILTGQATPLSPPLELWLDGDTVRGRATFGRLFMGPPGKVHGGVLSLALDMLMAKCQDFVTGLGMTGTLNIRYMAPTPLNTEIRFESRVTKVEGRKLLTEARVFAGDTQTVSATGVWISSQGNYQLRDAYAHLAEPADNDRETPEPGRSAREAR